MFSTRFPLPLPLTPLSSDVTHILTLARSPPVGITEVTLVCIPVSIRCLSTPFTKFMSNCRDSAWNGVHRTFVRPVLRPLLIRVEIGKAGSWP